MHTVQQQKTPRAKVHIFCIYCIPAKTLTTVMVTRSGRRVWNTNPSCFAPRTKARSSEHNRQHISTAFLTVQPMHINYQHSNKSHHQQQNKCTVVNVRNDLSSQINFNSIVKFKQSVNHLGLKGFLKRFKQLTVSQTLSCTDHAIWLFIRYVRP